jgi:hypothetical protein
MDPMGLELPTQIFATAAETIDLSAYYEEIRPFKKELINTQKWWLFMINAGNLSQTLGLTKVRLNPGEVWAHCTHTVDTWRMLIKL